MNDSIESIPVYAPDALIRSPPHHITIRVERSDLGDNIDIRSNNYRALKFIASHMATNYSIEMAGSSPDAEYEPPKHIRREVIYTDDIILRGSKLSIADGRDDGGLTEGAWLILVFKIVEQLLGYRQVYASDSLWHYKKTN